MAAGERRHPLDGADASAGQCEVAPFRGATCPGGARTTMTVVNDGTPCSIRNFIDPESRTPPAELRIVERPQNGTLTIAQPGTVSYAPRPGFSGPEHILLCGAGKSARRRPL